MVEAARRTESIRWSRSPKPANSKHPDAEFALRIAGAASSRRANSISCSTKPQASLTTAPVRVVVSSWHETDIPTALRPKTHMLRTCRQARFPWRSEDHTSEPQSPNHPVSLLLLQNKIIHTY